MEDHNSLEAAQQRADQADPIVMYLIVRESLGMGVGKSCAQCAHASQMLLIKRVALEKAIMAHSQTLFIRPSDTRLTIFDEWLDTSFRKVVLRASDKEWEKVKAEFPDHVLVVDAGLTEIAAGSETVIGLWPMRKSEVPKVVKKLQVLK